MGKKITAIMQARTSSTRLPGKVLLPLGGKTVLEQVIDRVAKASCIGELVIATSQDRSDDRICELCSKIGVNFFRGSLNDVLDRYYQAAKKFGSKYICRITSDCPFIDPEIIDRVADKYFEMKCDYISTGRIVTTFPDGMDTEIFSFESLERAWRESSLPSEREHVTPYIWKNTDKFKISELKNDVDLSRFRLTIDEPADYELAQKIFSSLTDPKMEDIIEFLEKNESIKDINSSIENNQGYFKSLKEDSSLGSKL